MLLKIIGFTATQQPLQPLADKDLRYTFLSRQTVTFFALRQPVLIFRYC